ncbi:MAG: DUF3617 domain-containing protein [Pseudomonadota bacterium]|nr:DUF3617 domain-containing protein [Pseudomonadota bacterium]
MKLSAPLFLCLPMLGVAAMAQKKPPAAAPAPPAATTSAAKTSVPGAMMKPGLWEITIVNETAGSTTKRTVTSRSCYALADVTDVGRVVPQQREFGMKCETRDAKQQGFDASWRVACSGKDLNMNGNGKMSLAAESFSGRAELQLKGAATKPVKVQQKVSGTWMGPCK